MMCRALLFVNMIIALVWLVVGEIESATFHLVLCVLCQLDIDREERL